MLTSIVILLSVSAVSYGAPTQCQNELKDHLGRSSIELENVHFYLYTREHIDDYCEVKTGDLELLKSCGFNPDHPTKIATHGWNDNALKENSVQYLKSAFLDLGEFNYIGVDWSHCSNSINYFHAVDCTRDVGHYIGDFIQFLMSETGLKHEDVHVLGHSLGAHVCGFISDLFPDKKIGRITGFDPAGPLFQSEEESGRLDPNDADFIDVIHTDMVFLGISLPVGTVDFYPNGGNHQPGCNGITKSCNHRASHRYFFATIPESERHKYPAKKCESFDQAKDGDCNGTTCYLGYESYGCEPGIYYIKMDEIP